MSTTGQELATAIHATDREIVLVLRALQRYLSQDAVREAAEATPMVRAVLDLVDRLEETP